MKPDSILQADLLDIIFEKKNKDYGAYALRKFYHERLYKSLGIIFLTVSVLALISFFYKNKTNMNVFEIPDTDIVGVFDIPKDQPKAPEQPQQPQKPVAPSSAVPSADQKPIVSDQSSTNIVIAKDGDKIDIPVAEGNETPPGEVATGGDDHNTSLPITGTEPTNTIDRTIPLNRADIMPAFPGGMEALRKYLEKNLVYPKELEAGETVSVKIKFIVGYDGSLRGFETIEDGGEVYNNEVIRVLKKMPAWIPGKAHGENVSVFYVVPVKFTSGD